VFLLGLGCSRCGGCDRAELDGDGLLLAMGVILCSVLEGFFFVTGCAWMAVRVFRFAG